MTHIVLKAKNDINGNPRRLSLLIEDGEVVKMSDHGHCGCPRTRDGWPLAACEINVTPKEYSQWKGGKK